MKWCALASLVAAVTLSGCEGLRPAEVLDDPASGLPDAGAGDLAPAPTWTYVYENYFGPNTPGHCGDPRCHGSPLPRKWVCGTTAESCYAGMVKIGIINTANPTASSLVDPFNSSLVWIDPDYGSMPEDDLDPNPAGAAAVAEWVAAGAQNN